HGSADRKNTRQLRVGPASGLPEATTGGEATKLRLQCLSFPHIIRSAGRWCCSKTLVPGHQSEVQREAYMLHGPAAMRSGDWRAQCECNAEYSGPKSSARYRHSQRSVAAYH